MVVDVEEKVAAKEKEFKKEKEKEILKKRGLSSHNSNTVTQSANCCTE